MAKLVSLPQAAQNAVQTWLKTQFPDVEVSDRWPEPTVKLPARAITVLRAGAPEREPIDPVVVDVQPVVDSTNRKLYRWETACFRQRLQLDVWATTDVDRDDIDAQLEGALNAGQTRTIGLPNFDPTRTGLLLKIEDGWSTDDFTTYADIVFDGPDVSDTPGSVTTDEFRSTWRAVAEMNMTIVAESAAIASVTLRSRIAESMIDAGEMSPDETVVLSE